jgi:hypothetical protein
MNKIQVIQKNDLRKKDKCDIVLPC